MTEVNYTAEMVARLHAEAPLDYAKAKTLGAELGKTYRSVIAKAKREGIEYVAKAPEPKRPKGVTKADMVAEIEAKLEAELPGLSKAPSQTLTAILGAL